MSTLTKIQEKSNDFTNNSDLKNKSIRLNFCKQTAILQSLFVEISGFQNKEHIGNIFKIDISHNSTNNFHDLLQQNLKSEKNNFALLKNIKNDGSHYWTKGEFKMQRDNTILFKIGSEVTCQIANSKINNLHNVLFSIEKNRNNIVAKKYLEGFLEEKNHTSYKNYIDQIA
jgi:hypothetical protein